jgi:hypothetical protein
MSSAVPDGTNTPLPIEGGPPVVTGGNTLVPVSLYVKDGNDVTQGNSSDSAVVGDVPGSHSAKLRGLSKIWNAITGATGAAVPGSATYMGGNKAGNLTGVSLDGSGNLFVNMANGNANGQTTMSQGAPVTLASNQSGIGTLTLPNINDTWINQAMRAGQNFMASSGQNLTATNPNLTMGACIFNNSTAKSMLIYSVLVESKNFSLYQIYQSTVDGAFGQAMQQTNLNFGSGTTSLATTDCTATGATASVSKVGTNIIIASYGSSVMTEALTNGMAILLPAGSAHGMNIYPFVSTAGDHWAVLIKWIEF